MMKNLICSVSIFLAVCSLFAAEQKKLLIVSTPEEAGTAAALMRKENVKPFAALQQSGAASGIKKAVSDDLLKPKAFSVAAYNNLIVVGLKNNDSLLEKCWGHQAAIDPETKTFSRRGYGTLRGDIGYVECDWNPFLYSNQVRTNPFTTVIVKISGTSEAGVKAAVKAFQSGLLNGVVPAGKLERVKTSILDRDPDMTPPPRLPQKVRIGDQNAYLCGWTQPSEEEYRAYIDIAGFAPLKLWRVKYLADGALNDVSARAWVNGLHRLAYGNSVMIAEFKNASEAQKTWQALSRFRGAKQVKIDSRDAAVFDQPRDEAFDKSYGKIYYLQKGKSLYAVSLPESAIPAIMK